MKPRFVIKTHKRIDRFGYFSLLVTRCLPDAYPTDSSAVAGRLTKLLEGTKDGIKVAAKFAVFMAQRFGFLSVDMRKPWRGDVLAGTQSYLNRQGSTDPSAYFDLTRIEKLLYCKYLLEADGAVVLDIAEKIGRDGEVRLTEMRATIDETFRSIVERYKDLEPMLHERFRLQELLRRMQVGQYDQGEVDHKIIPHMGFLEDLGLLCREAVADSDEVTWKGTRVNEVGAHQVILREIPNIEALERIIEEGRSMVSSATVLGLRFREYDRDRDSTTLEDVVLDCYQRMRDSTTGMVQMEALCDLAEAIMIVENAIAVAGQDVERTLLAYQKNHPYTLSFQVGFGGKDTLVVIREIKQKV